MPAPTLTRADDERLLSVLDRVDHDGLTGKVAGAPFGMSSSAVAGVRKRCRDDLKIAGDCLCKKPENRDGGMPRRWWRQ